MPGHRRRRIAIAMSVLIGIMSPLVAGCSALGGAADPAASDVVSTAATVAAGTACAGPASGLHEITVNGGGAPHAVRIVVPASTTGVRAPVVIGFHGLGSDGAAQAALSGYEELAEEEGFIAVHPTAIANGDDPRATWQLALPTDGTNADDHDDLAFAAALIDELVTTWCADPGRVYATGMSNGGFFTARLVCELSDRLAAAVSVAGLFRPDDCAAARPLPYLAIHGTADDFIPFDGDGRSVLLGSGTSLPAEFLSTDMRAAFAAFAAGAGCSPTAIDTVLDPESGGTTVRHTYSGCDDGVPMAFVEVIGGGHTWPGGDGMPPAALDATVDGWAFMSQFTLPAP